MLRLLLPLLGTTDGCRWCGLLLLLGCGVCGLLRVQKIQNKRLNKQRHFRVEILPIQIIGFGLVTNVRWLSGGILPMLRSDLIPQQFCSCIRDVGIYTWEEARLLIAMILATPYSIVQINSIGTSSISVVLTVTAHIRKILATMSCGTPF